MKQVQILQYSERFTSFETWKEALEREWQNQTAEFQIQEYQYQIEREAYFEKFQLHKIKKLDLYSQNPALAKVANHLKQILESKKIFKDFQTQETKLDERFANFYKMASTIVDPGVHSQIEEIKNEEESLKQQWGILQKKENMIYPVGETLRGKGKINSQRTLTLAFIEALEKDDVRSSQIRENCRKSPFIHPDISSDRYVTHLDQMRLNSRYINEISEMMEDGLAKKAGTQTNQANEYFPLLLIRNEEGKNIWSKDFRSANTSWAERSQSPRSDSPNSSRL